MMRDLTMMRCSSRQRSAGNDSLPVTISAGINPTAPLLAIGAESLTLLAMSRLLLRDYRPGHYGRDRPRRIGETGTMRIQFTGGVNHPIQVLKNPTERPEESGLQ